MTSQSTMTICSRTPALLSASTYRTSRSRTSGKLSSINMTPSSSVSVNEKSFAYISTTSSSLPSKSSTTARMSKSSIATSITTTHSTAPKTKTVCANSSTIITVIPSPVNVTTNRHAKYLNYTLPANPSEKLHKC